MTKQKINFKNQHLNTTFSGEFHRHLNTLAFDPAKGLLHNIMSCLTQPLFIIFSNITCLDQADCHQTLILYKNVKLKVKNVIFWETSQIS
jgi:hypothetical protein